MRIEPWTEELHKPGSDGVAKSYAEAHPVETALILDGIVNGVAIDYTGDRTVSRTCENLKSALADEVVRSKVSKIIGDDVAAGKTAGPFPQPPFSPFSISPIGAVPKKGSDKVRKIHHLSFPRGGDSINANTLDLYQPLQNFQAAADHVRAAGAGCWLIKLDVEAAYRQVPVRRSDWGLLGFKWRNTNGGEEYYYDRTLPFGLKSSCRLWELFATALHYFCEHLLGIRRVVHYIDDFLFVVESHSNAVAVLALALALCKRLGLPMAQSKIEGPIQCLQFLGLELDTVAMEARLGAKRLGDLVALLEDWKGKTHATTTERQSLAGILNFAATVVAPGRTFLQRIFADIRQRGRKGGRYADKAYPISSALQADLDWWRAFASVWNGVCIVVPGPWIHAQELFTDACLTGWGAYYQGRWCRGEWTAAEREQSIRIKRESMPYLELRALLLAVTAFKEQWRGKRVIFRCDAHAATDAIKRGYSGMPHTAALLRQLHFLSVDNGFEFQVKWIAGADNGIADVLSRYAQLPRASAASTSSSRAPRTDSAATTDGADVESRDATLNISTRYYLNAAIAPATRAAYETAKRSYMQFCESIDPLSYDITSIRVADWIVSLADGGQHAGNTIAVYLSGISTWWESRVAGSTITPTNPTSVVWVRRVLQGIKNELARVDQVHRQQRYVEPLLMATVSRIQRQFNLEVRADLTIFAAAALGVAALLRPNALLGTNTYKDRGVRAEHLTFFTATMSPMPRDSPDTPDHFSLFVPIDKTDQGRTGHTRIIAATTAVSAIWRLWKISPPTGPLFTQKSGSPLRGGSLIRKLKEALKKEGYAHFESFSGKSFRRGGASTLAEAGVQGNDLAQAGAWAAGSHVPNRYIGAAQHRQRAVEISRMMERA